MLSRNTILRWEEKYFREKVSIEQIFQIKFSRVQSLQILYFIVIDNVSSYFQFFRSILLRKVDIWNSTKDHHDILHVFICSYNSLFLLHISAFDKALTNLALNIIMLVQTELFICKKFSLQSSKSEITLNYYMRQS